MSENASNIQNHDEKSDGEAAESSGPGEKTINDDYQSDDDCSEKAYGKEIKSF